MVWGVLGGFRVEKLFFKFLWGFLAGYVDLFFQGPENAKKSVTMGEKFDSRKLGEYVGMARDSCGTQKTHLFEVTS